MNTLCKHCETTQNWLFFKIKILIGENTITLRNSDFREKESLEKMCYLPEIIVAFKQN